MAIEHYANYISTTSPPRTRLDLHYPYKFIKSSLLDNRREERDEEQGREKNLQVS
jgi:hypothetical protein